MNDIKANQPYVKLDKKLHNLEHLGDAFSPQEIPSTLSLPSYIRIMEFHVTRGEDLLFTHIDPFGQDKLTIKYNDILSFGAFMPLQAHSYFEMYYVVSGQLNMEIGKSLISLSVGDFLILNRSVKNRIHSMDKCVIYTLSLSSAFIQNFPQISGFHELRQSTIGKFFYQNLINSAFATNEYIIFHASAPDLCTQAVSTSFHCMAEELRHKQKGIQYMIYGYLVRLGYTLLNRDLFFKEYVRLETHNESQIVEFIMSYLENNKRRVTIKELASHLHYNEKHISRIFLKNTGESIHSCNQRIYFEEAQHLLIHTNTSISEIAELLGFVNKTQFYRLFQKRYGMGPGEYRQVQPK